VRQAPHRRPSGAERADVRSSVPPHAGARNVVARFHPDRSRIPLSTGRASRGSRAMLSRSESVLGARCDEERPDRSRSSIGWNAEHAGRRRACVMSDAVGSVTFPARLFAQFHAGDNGSNEPPPVFDHDRCGGSCDHRPAARVLRKRAHDVPMIRCAIAEIAHDSRGVRTTLVVRRDPRHRPVHSAEIDE